MRYPKTQAALAELDTYDHPQDVIFALEPVLVAFAEEHGVASETLSQSSVPFIRETLLKEKNGPL